MHITHFALQNLRIVEGEVLTDFGERFDREAYARFKYGYLPPAITYGRGLARAIGDTLFDIAGSEPIRIVSAPYKHLPTASHAIAQVLTYELSKKALDHEVEPPVLVPFHKSRTGSSNYAKSSEADRLRSLATLGLRIDESLIRGTHVLIVDDIRITGSAEQATASYLEAFEPKSVWYLHAARLPEGLGKSYPGLEDELNQSTSHDSQNVLRDVMAGQFQLNTRVLRHILEYDEPEYRFFLSVAPHWLLSEMHSAALGSGLSYYRKHQVNLDLLSVELSIREGNLTHAGL